MAFALDDPRLKKACKPGTGQVYRIFTSSSDSGRHGYVGQNKTSLYDRLKTHKRESTCCRALHAAFAKYGLAAFQIEVLESNIPLASLSDREIHWISVLDTYKKGYNLTIGGDFSPFADADIKARAEAARATPESKAKLNASLKASWNAEGVREKQSKRSLELWNDPNSREEMIKAQKRGHQDEKVRAAKSKTSKTRWQDPNWVAKRNATAAESRKRPGHFEKHSAASKNAWTPERRATHGAKCRATLLKKKLQVS